MSSVKKVELKVSAPVIIPHSQHQIESHNIGKNALKVLHGLKNAGFDAYLVGGGVRDLLLGLNPKDFDIVTDARPEQVKKLFRNCILIGRRFRLAHVRFGREIIEVATFRSKVQEPSDKYQLSEQGMLLRDNVYGTIEEDVWRRDFTVNALYYRIKDCSIIDYTDGLKDLKTKTIRTLGEPLIRFREDPVRILRAIRFAAKLGFKISQKTSVPIKELIPLFANISPARLFEEVMKWFRSGKSLAVFNLLQSYGLFAFLFPQVAASLNGKKGKMVSALLYHGFTNTDQRLSEDKPINSAFLFAVLLWGPVQELAAHLQNSNKNISETTALHQAMNQVLRQQKRITTIPQKLILTIKDIWTMQAMFASKKSNKIYSILAHPKFRAAYDFLLLRASSGEPVEELANWWTHLQEVDATQLDEIINQHSKGVT